MLITKKMIHLSFLLMFPSVCNSFGVHMMPLPLKRQQHNQQQQHDQHQQNQHQQQQQHQPCLHMVSSSSSSYNPIEFETPEERAERMRLVRQIQQVYYKGEGEDLNVEHNTLSSSSLLDDIETEIHIIQHNNGNDEDDDTTSYSNTNPHHNNEKGTTIDDNDDLLSSSDPTILDNVPLWRVQWTELPGFQNVLNCHVPHYTHMFRRILSGPKPWLFGHVYLPGGSENLSNPLYKLPDQYSKRIEEEETHDEMIQRIYGGGSSTTPVQPTTCGTLMQITDYQESEEDGHLILIVQALERFQIQHATQHIPYAIASIRLDPDQELVQRYILSDNNDNNNNKQKKKEQQRHIKQHHYDPTIAVNDAARLAAVVETNLWRDWEFRPTTIPNNDNHISIDDDHPTGVSRLVNYNTNNNKIQEQQIDIYQEAIKARNKFLLIDEEESTTTNPNSKSKKINEKMKDEDDEEVQEILQLESDVWIALDKMLRLLGMVAPTLRIALPTQLLSLLPSCHYEMIGKKRKWPKGFRVQHYVSRLLLDSSFSKDDKSKNNSSSYPSLRRAARFSYVLWELLDSIGLDGAPTRQIILEESSIANRLEATLHQLDAVNVALREALAHRRSEDDNDDKKDH